jgi:hypothetical protein
LIVSRWQQDLQKLESETRCLKYLEKDFFVSSKLFAAVQNNFPPVKNKGGKFAQSYVFNNHIVAAEKFEILLKNDKWPENIIVAAYHRRFVKKSNSLFSELQP